MHQDNNLSYDLSHFCEKYIVYLYLCGIHTITYDYTDGNGCFASITDDVEVFAGSKAVTTMGTYPFVWAKELNEVIKAPVINIRWNNCFIILFVKSI